MDRKIAVVGMWHLGCVTAACLARLGFEVTCLDSDKSVIENLKSGVLPIHEPGLKELFEEHSSKSLFFSHDFGRVIPQSDIVYIAHDVPVDENDIPDLSVIDNALAAIIPLLKENALVFVSSQIPIGTSDKICEKLGAAGKNNKVAYIPENLRLGTALNDFLRPERIVVGLSNTSVRQRVADVLSGIQTKLLFMGLKSAEMMKHALNSYLATLISFSGEISDLCEKTGADAVDVMNALKGDRRVSQLAPINPGLGFGGGTLARDVQVLRTLGSTKLLDAVLSVNTERMGYVRRRLLSIFGSLSGRKIAFLGLTYKAGTSTLRRSTALQIIRQLNDSNAVISAYDPMVKGQVENYGYVDIAPSPEEAAKDADAIVITTDLPEFATLDFVSISKSMKSPVILDTKNMLAGKFNGTDIKYYGVGGSMGVSDGQL